MDARSERGRVAPSSGRSTPIGHHRIEKCKHVVRLRFSKPVASLIGRRLGLAVCSRVQKCVAGRSQEVWSKVRHARCDAVRLGTRVPDCWRSVGLRHGERADQHAGNAACCRLGVVMLCRSANGDEFHRWHDRNGGRRWAYLARQSVEARGCDNMIGRKGIDGAWSWRVARDERPVVSLKRQLGGNQ